MHAFLPPRTFLDPHFYYTALSVSSSWLEASSPQSLDFHSQTALLADPACTHTCLVEEPTAMPPYACSSLGFERIQSAGHIITRLLSRSYTWKRGSVPQSVLGRAFPDQNFTGTAVPNVV